MRATGRPRPRRRPWRGLLAVALVLALAAWPTAARAATWGGIAPGQTTRRDVEARYGKPSRERTVTEEGRTVVEWTYVGDRAPQGVDRMVLSFGLIRGGSFVPDLVRALTLYPKQEVFRVPVIVQGWGKPDAIGTDSVSGRPAFRYDALGLLVLLDKTGAWAEMMLFGPERPGASP